MINLLIFLLLSFSQKSRKKSSKGRGTTRKKYRLVFEKYTVFDKKSKKSLKKKKSNFFYKFNFFNFFEFFSENVLKSLLRGRETTRKKYPIVFEKLTFFEKKTKKMLKKKSCSKFFDKFKNFHFFRVFLRKCLKNSSKGTRNN